MTTNAESIRAKLLTVSKEKKIIFQDLLNRYGAEQFLARLSASRYVERFIFKGGSLLTYLIESDRRTKDLDFSVLRIGHEVEKALEVIKKILGITLDDGLTWLSPQGAPLRHPELVYPGLRIKCPFKLGTAKGMVRMDLAAGDLVEPRKIFLARIRYRGKPLIGPDFSIMAYPPETIFAEKMQIAVKRGGQNTRMKDYYDLFKLAQSKTLEPSLLRRSIERTFSKRTTTFTTTLDLSDENLKKLQVYWSAYLRKMTITDAPGALREVVRLVNRLLEAIHKDER
ncbi:MAG: nucleotidyl transferase AbiEii/AbiGii toxin family protein [Pseudomonadota bacterium]